MPADPSELTALIAEAKASGGSELANYQLFVERLCAALALPRPAMAREENALNDYVFERRIAFKHPDGSATSGRIDCYKRNCFILEAKQSAKRQTIPLSTDQSALLSEDERQRKLGHAKRGTRGWDQVMLAARRQAEDYARALPVEHGYPPFLLIVDVGHVIEVYADFSGQGKNYAHFPDRQSYRLGMDDLLDPKIQSRLAAIWTEPLSLDPARISAEVTRDIAERLARIARKLEARHEPKNVAEFLMRCLFTMFAEDVKLIPDKGFLKLLEQMKETPQHFVAAMESLWAVMDQGGYAPHLNATLKRFNGSLFKTRKALPLERDEIVELLIAAGKDWSDVEPAIFGTLLERALDPRERSKLGAHYTPRAYVERLVVPTIIEPLRADWAEVQAFAEDLRAEGKTAEALQAIKDFHHKLCITRVLDPACGTGNFLYVSLELMKKLEGEVLEALEAFGEAQARFVMQGESVNPRQFYGLELNPRAVPIADLVLWIGYLKWQLKTGGLSAITEPILDAYGTIREQDAILAYDRKDLQRDDTAKPLTRWDGISYKPHPITGDDVPDPDATVPLYSYINPRPAPWPEADFIVGNPPFVGAKYMRAELGDGYAEAAWKARPHIPGGADFVMHFWDEAATRLTLKSHAGGNPLRRFGFITTNSVFQTFSRRVIDYHMAKKNGLSLVYAVPDHPWLKASDKAAVRIAMSVAERGQQSGMLAEVIAEDGLDTDTPAVSLTSKKGKIKADLTIGADLRSASQLLANEALAYRGVQIIGAGFIVTPEQASALGRGRVADLDSYILDYRNGRDLAQRPRGVMVIDLFPLAITEVQERFSAVYQHILHTVKPERDQNSRASYRENWWIFGEPRRDMRPAISGLSRYITTVQTAKHRLFQFLDASIRPDDMLIAIGLPSSLHLGVLSSRLHIVWALAAGGWLGVGNDSRYIKTQTFDQFPFPLRATDATAVSGNQIADLGERLDAFRKQRLAEHEVLTMTGLYNVLERLRELDNNCDVPPLNDKERAIHEAGLVSVLKEIHDDIDRAVFDAYGWSDLAPKLVGKPGGTTPSPHKTPEQEQAEEELLTRLVALNHQRAAEEKRGLIRWLRPDYQIPRLGAKAPQAPAEQPQELTLEITAATQKPKWPGDAFEQIRLVRDLLSHCPTPTLPEAIAASFDGRLTPARKQRIVKVLETLVATGSARQDHRSRYFVPR